jgi:hypothetical protein
MQYLRLDMYINSREYLIGEADATEAGFEEILNLSDIIDGRIAAEIRAIGTSDIPHEYRSDELLSLIFEFTGIDAGNDDEINFCMCLWQRDEENPSDVEHLESAYKLSSLMK